MNLSDRNNRLLVVFTAIGLTAYLFPKFFLIVKNSFAELYINSMFPIRGLHLFTATLLTDLIMVLVLCLVYCYNELHNYGNYNGEKSIKYARLADKCFQLLLEVSFISFLLTFVTLFLTTILIPLILSFKKVSLFVAIILLLLFGMITWLRWKRKCLGELVKQTKWILGKYSKYGLIILIWVFLMPTIALIGLGSNVEPKFKVQFVQNEKPQIEFTYTDHVPDYLPKNILINIATSEGKKEITLTDKDFKKSFIEVQSDDGLKVPYVEKNSDQIFLINKSSYTYTKSVSLDSYLKEGQGYIEIIFTLDDSTSRNKQ